MRKLILFICILPALAGAELFENAKNLEVLNKNISAKELQSTMKNFSISLGVRCQHCHVGEEGQPLAEFDFAADDKASKDKARVMLKMVRDLNRKIESKIPDSSVQIECITCHRGAAIPIQTVDLLNDTYADHGVEDALAKYDELKASYFGSHTYDFTENTLLTLATKMFPKDPTASFKALEKNLEQFPKGTQTLITMGELLLAQKQKQKALEYFIRAQNLQPNPWLEQKIKAIKELQ